MIKDREFSVPRNIEMNGFEFWERKFFKDILIIFEKIFLESISKFILVVELFEKMTSPIFNNLDMCC